MLSRREWLKNTALVGAGLLTVERLDILDRLAPRSLFASAPIARVPLIVLAPWAGGAMIPDGGYEAVCTSAPRYVQLDTDRSYNATDLWNWVGLELDAPELAAHFVHRGDLLVPR